MIHVGSAAQIPCWINHQVRKWKNDLVLIACGAHLLFAVLKHPRVPWHAKVIAGCAVAYLVSPIQLIPTFIPVVGQMDDLLILFAGMSCLRRLVSAEVLAECEAGADSWRIAQSARLRVVLRRLKERRISAA